MSELKIGGIKYSIVHVSEMERDGVKLMGLIEHETTEITVVKGMSRQAEAQVILHEGIHAILVQMGRSVVEEELIDGLAYGIMGLMRWNPWLVGMVMGLDREKYKGDV